MDTQDPRPGIKDIKETCAISDNIVENLVKRQRHFEKRYDRDQLLNDINQAFLESQIKHLTRCILEVDIEINFWENKYRKLEQVIMKLHGKIQKLSATTTLEMKVVMNMRRALKRNHPPPPLP